MCTSLDIAYNRENIEAQRCNHGCDSWLKISKGNNSLHYVSHIHVHIQCLYSFIYIYLLIDFNLFWGMGVGCYNDQRLEFVCLLHLKPEISGETETNCKLDTSGHIVMIII